MNDFSVSMALVDYIPVILFTIGSIILMRDLYNKMSKGAFALFSAGVIDVTLSGALKATWKLLYAAGVCDFERLNNMFFPVQSIGFLLAGLGILAMLIHKQTKKAAALAVVPPVYSGTFIFIILMISGLGMMQASLCVLAKKMKKSSLIVIFIISFICSLGMGYLSTKDFAQASMNWIAEVVNFVGQLTSLIGIISLHKSGLADLKLRNEELA